jgi:hypothetical protein
MGFYLSKIQKSFLKIHKPDYPFFFLCPKQVLSTRVVPSFELLSVEVVAMHKMGQNNFERRILITVGANRGLIRGS